MPLYPFFPPPVGHFDLMTDNIAYKSYYYS
jgi:hypothetical protein